MAISFFNPIYLENAVRAALDEDLGRAGDITTLATIPNGRQATGVLAVRKPGTVAGLPVAEAVFRAIDPSVRFEALVEDGTQVAGNRTPVARVSGDARAILTAERVALNFMCRLSGIATLTAKYVALVAHTNAKICCTRKTTPGLRALEKYAVRCGGAMNHRFGLDGVAGERLLAKHRLSSLQGRDGPLRVAGRGQGIVDDVHVIAGDQRGIVRGHGGDGIFLRVGPGAVRIARANARDNETRVVPQRGEYGAPGYP